MIDTLEANRSKAEQLTPEAIIKDNLIEGQSIDTQNTGQETGKQRSEVKGQKSKIRDQKSGPEPNHSSLTTPNSLLNAYALMTMHRPSNVDEKQILEPLFNFLNDQVAYDMPLIWPIHPRSQKRLQEFGLWEKALNSERLILLHPVGYHEMLRLNMDARLMLNDSGGLQEECCVLGTPCLTLRWNTERPVTLREHGGASVLVGNNIERIQKEYQDTLRLERKPQRPELWDGNTAGRCLEAIVEQHEEMRR